MIKIKTIYILALLIMMSINASSQEYTCERMKSDIKSWNEIKQKNNTKWANAIKDKMP